MDERAVITGDIRNAEEVLRTWIWKSKYDALENAYQLLLGAIESIAETEEQPLGGICRVLAKAAPRIMETYD